MLELAGFNGQRESVKALEESKRIIIAAHDEAIRQAKMGMQVDEGLFTGLRAALATAATSSAKVAKSIARKASELSDAVKKIYQDEKCKLELKELLKGMATVAGHFEKVEKEAPTLLKKDERVREIVKVFRDALETMQRELQARAIPPEKLDPAMTESEVQELLRAFLTEGTEPIHAHVHDGHVADHDYHDKIMADIANHPSMTHEEKAAALKKAMHDYLDHPGIDTVQDGDLPAVGKINQKYAKMYRDHLGHKKL